MAHLAARSAPVAISLECNLPEFAFLLVGLATMTSDAVCRARSSCLTWQLLLLIESKKQRQQNALRCLSGYFWQRLQCPAAQIGMNAY